MLIKKVICRVADSQAEAFSKAQSVWRQLSQIEGFIKQTGGWQTDENGGLTAVIIGVWENRRSYDMFMEQHHDSIFASAQQKDTYQSITVTLCEEDEAGDIIQHPDYRPEPDWTVVRT